MELRTLGRIFAYMFLIGAGGLVGMGAGAIMKDLRQTVLGVIAALVGAAVTFFIWRWMINVAEEF